MMFAHDTQSALVWAAALVNTAADEDDRLTDVATLNRLLDDHDWTGRRDGTDDELDAVRALRPRWRTLWDTDDVDRLVGAVNTMLAESDARPHLTRHGSWGWHLHVTRDDAPLADRMLAETAVALAELVRSGQLERLRTCEADDCDAVLVDLSRNRSRRYCDTGNCGNRTNVAAYRARKRT